MALNAHRMRERKLEAAAGYLELDLPERALRELDEIVDPEASPLEFYRLRGEARKVMGRFASAIGDFDRALAESPDDLGILLSLGWCYKRTDQLPRAIAALEQAYGAHPKEPYVLYNMACYYTLAGEKAQALSWLGRALRMKSDLRELIPDEPDFDPLRNDPDFQYVAGMGNVADR